MSLVEINFDGIVGPTHNFAGLSLGNLAATAHAGQATSLGLGYREHPGLFRPETCLVLNYECDALTESRPCAGGHGVDSTAVGKVDAGVARIRYEIC